MKCHKDFLSSTVFVSFFVFSFVLTPVFSQSDSDGKTTDWKGKKSDSFSSTVSSSVGSGKSASASWKQPDLILEAKPGSERHIGTVELMWPFGYTDRSTWFIDVRGRLADEQLDDISDDNSEEGNFGIGRRWITGRNQSVIGVYAYYDHLNSVFDNQYSQVTVGGEYFFSKNWLGRINGYYPEDNEQDTGVPISNEVELSNGQIQVLDNTLKENALPGFDIEIGRQFQVFQQPLWVYGTYFRFDRSGYSKVEGGRARVETAWNTDWIASGSRLTTGVEVQNDDVRDTQTFAIARLSIPLGSPEKKAGHGPDWTRERLGRRVERDVDIVADQQVETERFPAVDPETGTALTEENVEQTTADQIDNGEDAIAVLVDGGERTETLTLNIPGQNVLGGGTEYRVQHPETGETFVLTVPGNRPSFQDVDVVENNVSLANLDTEDLTVSADDVRVKDVQINGFLRTDDSAGGFSNLSLRNVSVTGWQGGRVNGTFTTDYLVQPNQSIQTTLDSASAGDVVSVAPGTYSEKVTVTQSDLDVQALLNAGTPGYEERSAEATINGVVEIQSEQVTFDGFDVSPPEATDDLDSEALTVSSTVDHVTVQNNIVRDFGENGISEWEGVEGIVGFGGDETDALTGLSIRNNLIKDITGRDDKGGAAGVMVQGHVTDVDIRQNRIRRVGGGETQWAQGVVITGTGNHSETPENVSVRKNDIRDVISISTSSTVGVGVGVETDGPEFFISDNTLADNEFGVEVKAGADDTIINRNNITGNSEYGVINKESGVTLDATNNWWGAADGPSGQGSGSGDAVTDDVQFDPWAESPF